MGPFRRWRCFFSSSAPVGGIAGGHDKPLHEDSQLQEPDGHNIKLLWADFLEAIDEGREPVAGIDRAHRLPYCRSSG